MVAHQIQEAQVQTVRALAPEDIHPGDVVVILHEFDQVLARVGGSGELPGSLPEFRVVRVRSMGSYPSAQRVIGVALPFLLVEDRDGHESLIDVRLKDLGRLPAALGARAMKALDDRRKQEAAAGHAESPAANPGGTCPCEQAQHREGSD